jgi:DNA-binding GntR family transcriptional regulator
MIEVQALRLCFLHRRQPALAQLRQASEAMELARRHRNHLASARADAAFHDGLVLNCTNPYLISAYRLASGKVAALRAHRSSPDTRSAANSEHQQVIEAFACGDLTRAEVVLTEHILKMRDRYKLDVDPVRPAREGKRTQGAAGALGRLAD